jgi:hypothetical protein
MANIIFLCLLIIFVVWLRYEIAKSNRLSKKSMDEYWKREAQANQTRKVDISNLDYISIPYDKLPLEDNPDQTINSYRDTILSYSDKKILNLSAFSNTELKLKYGVSNINLLTEYDNNYTNLVAILHKWGERLYMKDCIKEALAVLNAAIDCKTDVHKTYELLAKIYISQGSHDKYDKLIDRISSMSIRDKEALLSKIQKLRGLR